MVNASTIKAIQDIMRKDVGVDGDAQRLGQLVWMLFLKIFDDREYEWEAVEPGYLSPIPEGLRWRDWAADDEGLTGDELTAFVNNTLFPTLKALAMSGESGRAQVVGSVFEDAYNYMKSGHLLRQVANKIQADIDFNKSGDRHTFGDLYEQLLKDLQNAGNAGEYYTPRAVTQFMVAMTDPKLGESILDPACGTGGFLSCTLEHLRSHYVNTADDEQIAQTAIHGVEKKPLPHLLCTTNMILHGVDVPTNVRHDNTLTRPLRDYGPTDRVDVVLTNPPFGGTEEDGIENNFPSSFRTRETADLFLVLIMHLLKPGGRAAIVLPDGSLYGDGVKARIRQRLLSEFNLHTIVRLPNGVFAPYTGIRTNLLFFEKGEPTQHVWFYEHRIPDGRPSYSKTRPLKYEHLTALREWWGDRREDDNAWRVAVDEIDPITLNLDLRHPNRTASPRLGLSDAESRLASAESKVADAETALASVLRSQSLPEPLISGIQKLSNRASACGVDSATQVERFRRAAVSLLVKPGLHDGLWGGQAPRANDIEGTWATRTLDSLGQMVGGMTPSKANRSFWTGEIPWTSSKDMKGRTLRDTELRISQTAMKETRLRLIPSDSVLMVVRSGILRRTFPVVVNSIPVTINQDLKALMLEDPTDARYIQLMLEGFESLILQQMVKRGTTVQSVKFDQLCSFEFPWPDDPDARAVIVQASADIESALLDVLQALETRREALIAYEDAVVGPAIEAR